VLNDPLRDYSKGYNWQEMSDKNGSCTFREGAYHAKMVQGAAYVTPCSAQNTDFTNFTYEVQMKILHGDCGALLFRSASTTTNYYYFEVCVDGTYALYLYGKSIASNAGTFIAPHSDIAIHKGLNQTNVVAVVAQVSTLDLYVNHSQVASISDGTSTNGQIGVAADGSMSNSSTEVAFSNARVWTL
jgi:eukaryotic-like serine/threonine-protein kinase